jgi:subtilase family serine protease
MLLLSAAFCTAAMLLSTPARAQQRQTLPTRVAAPAGSKVVGRLPASQRLSLAITLRLRNQEQLQSTLKQLYDPSSSSYRQFLSVGEFTDQFGPTTDDYQQVIGFAQSYGLTVTHQAPNRLVLDVSGTVAQIEQAFQVTLQVYQRPAAAGTGTFYAPNVEPSVEVGVPAQGVAGLNDFAPPRPIGLELPRPDERVHGNTTGSGPGGDFLGSDIRAAYAPGVTLDGAGQAVGLFEFGPYNISDVQAYFSTIGQPLNVPIVNELLDGVTGVCGAGCDDGEEVIDMEQSISMAPNLSAVIVYEGTDDVDMFNQMAVDNIAKQLSCSFGFLPADPSSDEPIFQEFAAQGQNLFVASGDGGAYYGNPTDCQNFSNLNGCVFYPADDPFITSAGGTDLTTNGPGGTWQSETGWVGSGGGWSTNGLAIPSYQVPVINSSNQGSKTLRNIPDLAAEANTDNYFCANGGCFTGVGGTSLSAPRWAGFLAMANQQAGGQPIGFMNPTIYTVGQSTNYDSDFHDITVGNNFNSGSPNMFSAVTGYDLVTGWGSPNGQGLLNALGPAYTGPNFGLSASPSTLNLTQGETGTSTITLSALNGFNSTVNLTATVLGQPAGVTATLNPTTISGSGTSTLTVTTSDSTPGGDFPIVVTGVSGTLTQTVYVTLALPGFTISAPANVFLNQGANSANTITVNAVNGFDGSVTLSASGMPKGVTAVFQPRQTKSTSKLTLTASRTAATGYATVTVTGTSGDITQTASINLAVSAATGTGGAGTPVNLTSSFNVTGIYTNGSMYSSSGGLDGGGYSYSANLLTRNRILTDAQFSFGPFNQPDAVSGTGVAVPLPAGQYSTLRMLATGVEGDQMSQVITVTYTDGTTAEFTQSFSDWFTPQNYPGEAEGVAMAYRNVSNGTQDDRTFNLYSYAFHLNSTKTMESFTLPDNRDLCVLAVTLEKAPPAHAEAPAAGRH